MYNDGWRSNTAWKMAGAIGVRPVAWPWARQPGAGPGGPPGLPKLEPPRARLPLPWAAARLVAQRLVDVGSWLWGAAVVFACIHYLRPRE
eukprot:3664071-Pyramimonas_sp.AAC.1